MESRKIDYCMNYLISQCFLKLSFIWLILVRKNAVWRAFALPLGMFQAEAGCKII
jgi:hypothetical protein